MVHPYTFLATSFKVPNSTFLQLCAMHVQFNLLSKEKSLISLFLSESSPLIFFILWYNAQVWSHSWSYLRLASPQSKEMVSDCQGCIQALEIKPSIFPSKLYLSSTGHSVSLQLQICSFKEFLHPFSHFSPSCSSPLGVCDRTICFSRQTGRKETFSQLSSSLSEDIRN